MSGPVRGTTYAREDSPPRLIESLRAMRMPLSNRNILVEHLKSSGFSDMIALWAATNLRRVSKENPEVGLIITATISHANLAVKGELMCLLERVKH